MLTEQMIYLQPLGKFLQDHSPAIETLTAYAGAFFMMDVKTLPPILIDDSTVNTRINPYSGNRQVFTGDILFILKKILPPDAFCVLAITMEDLYPDPHWNFVFGQASIRERVGVFSFARYNPEFYGEKRGANYSNILLRRSCKVLAHEMGHMFSMNHCIFFSCVMNGSNHLHESDSRPLFLCPVCLRKLHLSITFDVIERYRMLHGLYEKNGFPEEALWVSNRLKRLQNKVPH